jgi:hypothetical protein
MEKIIVCLHHDRILTLNGKCPKCQMERKAVEHRLAAYAQAVIVEGRLEAYCG